MPKGNLAINKQVWNEFTDEQLSAFKTGVFNHYRETGFPYYPTDIGSRTKEWVKLVNYDRRNVIQAGYINQTMHGLALAWSYFPHSFEVKCGDMRTPMEVFNDDDLFMKAIDKRIKHGDNMSDSGIRKILKMYTGTQGVSNFRPTAAAALYDKFAPGGVVWDMSCGYGGRLLGFEISKAAKYYGCEPATKTYNGLNELKSDFIRKPATIMKQGSEVTEFKAGELDFAFTSPPYFDWEKYSDEETQSYIKYPTLYSWVNGFLRDTLLNAYEGLKPGGFCCINIANTKRAPNVESDCIALAKLIGFKHFDTMYLKLSAMKSGFKTEPVFVFKK